MQDPCFYPVSIVKITPSVLLSRGLLRYEHCSLVWAMKFARIIAEDRVPIVEGVLSSGSVGEDNFNFV